MKKLKLNRLITNLDGGIRGKKEKSQEYFFFTFCVVSVIIYKELSDQRLVP